ncbi:uncharacterized protein LOC125853901 [Solanum stenotomum]|uniref:uncharacterized protein LOC125853901 n=1 Tax=Solanum stenotomum TaxID=172797 RepID=UPI0020D0F314|nr:uncharacterized protein LOC125853901 [Solanum stenotomum]
MRVTHVDKVELASFQLKGIAQIWYDQWKETRPAGLGPIEWEGFKSAFLDSFFPLEMREALLLEFIKLRQNDLSVKEYAWMFTQLSKYVPILVSNPKLGMSKFVSGLSELVVKECRMAMFEHNMYISCLVVYAFEIDQKKLKERLREKKRVRIDDDSSSLGRFSGQGPSKFFPRFSEERVSNPKPQRGRNSEFVLLKPTCNICGRKHYGRCLAGMEGCYGCGGSDHKMRDCSILTARGKERKKIRFNALQARGEQECPPNVAPDMCFMLI